MISVPYEQVVSKIKEKTGFSDDEINQKIKNKLEQLNGLISRQGAAHIVANELQVPIFEEFLSGKMNIGKILGGMRSLELIGKVIAKYDVKEFATEKSRGKVGSMILGDETGTIRVTLWHEQTSYLSQLNIGDVVRIIESRPLSKNKRWRLDAIIKKNISVEIKELIKVYRA